YSVISPEGCAAILWRNGEEAPAAAEAMRLTAQDLRGFGVVDRIIEEPVGGAHRTPGEAITSVGDAIETALTPLLAMKGTEIRHHRRHKFLEMGKAEAV
ncbi:MAG: acetyl-CoA carboxylase carboxyl transferase subunit alpha, partial [Pseudomonadota bacterium]